MTNAAINSKATEIILQFGKMEAPIRVDDIARAMGLKVVAFPLEGDVSGLLLIEADGATIGYNQNEARVRRRYTVAHELGHYCLGHTQEGTPSVFVDKGYRVYFRRPGQDEPSAARREREANYFAACLLMPEQLLVPEVDKLEFDPGNEDAIKHLAKMFDVSATAMSYRIQNLYA
ncbi:ImmA/IrrE family metallo-endopeptidase [Chitinophaga sp. LS1]|uniref:ImmA/IrrE family metallo-endopeptidase n=1 Tax=Chitinophaga sp. LS1 TaxID=3051176 RepID=UPI002AABAC39|nr:ImmA/IrrE family metallo-endopeptidase [Chitinophaga sp. LS1]WPV67512.1 ImmA/IrrE family metallo-endopeptidase [Chitinophaga sp. LS1]